MLKSVGNATPTKTEALVALPDMLRHVIIAGKSTRTAALELCYASAAFILLANHFQDTKSKDYLTKQDAITYLQKQIKEQANVQGGMLDLYIRNASTLCGVLTGSSKMFGPTIQLLALAKEPAEMVAILSKWMDDNYGKRVESMSALSEALGYKTSRPTGPADKTLTPTKAVEKIKTAMTAVEKIVGGAAGEITESKVAQAVISNAKSALVFAREAVKRIVDEDDLKALESTIKEQRAYLRECAKQDKELGDKAVAAVKERTASLIKAKPVHGHGSKRGQVKPVQAQV